ncbi:MAG: hypothetical protein JWN44_7035 [Myxococcales bacterium]|nr:hypothetical protein [Myxococcales bacterium]
MSFDVIVVLGAALGPDGDLGVALAERVGAGVEAWRSGLAPRMMMTGALEAELMKRRAVKLGVPAEQILVEPTALTTRENAVRCAELMRRHGLTRALVVTQGYHRPRAVAAFRRVGVAAEGYRFVGSTRWKLRAREVVARLAYRARGWI